MKYRSIEKIVFTACKKSAVSVLIVFECFWKLVFDSYFKLNRAHIAQFELLLVVKCTLM